MPRHSLTWCAVVLEEVLHWKVLKIDVEGGEWEVLQGAEPLLTAQRVLCVVLEYSHFWTSVTLKTLSRWMSDKGYDGYLLGSQHLIPVSGAEMEWWHELYEVCAQPDLRIYRGLAGWCWLNAAFVLRRSRLGTLAAQWVPRVGAGEKLEFGLPAMSYESLGLRCKFFGLAYDPSEDLLKLCPASLALRLPSTWRKLERCQQRPDHEKLCSMRVLTSLKSCTASTLSNCNQCKIGEKVIISSDTMIDK